MTPRIGLTMNDTNDKYVKINPTVFDEYPNSFAIVGANPIINEIPKTEKKNYHSKVK